MYKTAIQQTLAWVAAAAAFGTGLFFIFGSETSEEFFAGYLLEQSLSIDNLLVFLLLFEYFKIPTAYQNRVLNWGIIGAIGMRAIMIAAGSIALQQFHGVLLGFAAILIYSSAKILIGSDGEEEEDLSQNQIVQFSNNLIKSTDQFDGDRFFTFIDGVKVATPMLLCMVAVEFSDVIFAVDSIPAVFGVTNVSVVHECFLFGSICRVYPSFFLAIIYPNFHSLLFLPSEPLGRFLFQYVCYHGTSEFVHNPVQGSIGIKVLGASGGSGARFHWSQTGRGVLWYGDINGIITGCRHDGSGDGCGSLPS
jgi:TerC family integral membrane protein